MTRHCVGHFIIRSQEDGFCWGREYLWKIRRLPQLLPSKSQMTQTKTWTDQRQNWQTWRVYSIWLYMFIYIYSHSSTDSFFVSQLISVARHARCFKLESKPDWLDASRISYRTLINNPSMSEGILTHMYHCSFVYICVIMAIECSIYEKRLLYGSGNR